VLLPMIAGGHALRLVIRGGTHNPMAPPYEFLDRVFLPQLRAMGAQVTMTLDRHGFIGERGDLGQLTVEIGASEVEARLRPIELVEAPPISSRHAVAILARLPTHIADREFGIVLDRLGWSRAECEIRETRYGGPGNALMLEVERGDVVREIVSEIGEKGIRAELVAERACEQMERYLEANVPVGEHLADQLLLPMAVAGAGRFLCAPLSLHATTNIETIGRFLDVPIRDEQVGENVLVTVG